ncbi:MAG: hypothetical protein IPJ83_03740 [Saprospiraceae bacterium]|nr:hypothetical protein [Candidatus Vicinibacter proximus]MCC6843467.1 hypothetical protein [Saprospiraceae bacterium]
MEWKKKGSSNIGQFAVFLGGKSVDEFFDLLALKLGKTWMPCPPALCIDMGNGVAISHYIDASFNGPAILIVLPGGHKFKVRLQ